jgi:ABC-type glycerol-3-phosphate transport system permease component
MVGLTLFKGFYSVNVPATFAGLMVATIPMLAFYAFGQRFFRKGVIGGAIKE